MLVSKVEINQWFLKFSMHGDYLDTGPQSQSFRFGPSGKKPENLCYSFPGDSDSVGLLKAG